MNKAFLTFLLVFFALSKWMHAQEVSNNFYTIKDGLTQTQVMSIFQDSKGYIWIGANSAIFKFDGETFHVITPDLIPTGFVQDFEEDSYGNIWAAVSSGFVKIATDTAYYINTTFSPYRFTIDSQDVIWAITHPATDDKAIFQLEEEKMILLNDLLVEPGVEKVYDIFYDEKGQRIIITSGNLGLCTMQEDSIIPIPNNLSRPYEIISTPNNDIYIRSDSGIHQLVGRNLTLHHPNKVKGRLAIDNNGKVYLGGKDQIIQELPTGDTLQILNHVSNANCLFIDRENKLWTGTNGGLLHFPSQAFRYLGKQDGLMGDIWSIVQNESETYFASYSQGLARFDGKTFTNLNDQFSNIYPDNYFYFGAIKDSKGNLLFPNNLNLLKYNGKEFSILPGSQRKTVKDSVKLNRGVVMYVYEDIDRGWYFVGRAGLQILDEDGEVVFYKAKEDINLHAYITSINKIDSSEYWITSHAGLSRFNVETESFLTYTNTDSINYLPSSGVFCSYLDSFGQWWFGTHDGLMRYEAELDTFIMVDSHSLAPSGVSFITSISDKHLILGTEEGLMKFDVQKFHETKALDFQVFNENNGFSGVQCGQNLFYLDEPNRLWVGHGEEVVLVNPTLLEDDNYSPNIFIEKVSIPQPANKYVWETLANQPSGDDLFIVPREQNNLRIEFDAIKYTASFKASYQYRMVGDTRYSDWSELITENEITFVDLKPGNYKFEVRAVWPGLETTDNKVATFQFYVKANITTILLWILSSLILVIGLFFLIFYNKYKRSLSSARMQIELLRLKSIQSQMEPHFISNILNSIIGDIYSGDKRLASQKIRNLSDLIRRYLDAANENETPLEKDISVLKTYVNFEQKRFNNFTTEYNISPDLDLQIKIPPMLIQPFVENAINHGLQEYTESNKGLLVFNLYKTSTHIIVEVIDNGIGRRMSEQMKSNSIIKRVSRGTTMMMDRIKALKHLKIFDIEIEVEDAQNMNVPNTGTKVTIRIAKKLQ